MDAVRLSRRLLPTPRSSVNRISLEEITPLHGDGRLAPISTKKKSRSIESLNTDRSSREFAYPQRITIGPKSLTNPCSSQVTMCYRSDSAASSVSQPLRRDEVVVHQFGNNGSSWIVFKGFLKEAELFTFKSRRSIDDRFHLKLEINGYLDTTISGCCEHPYRHGGRIDDGDSSFWIVTVEQHTPCTKCKESKDSSDDSDGDEDVILGNTSSDEDEEEEESQPKVLQKPLEVEPVLSFIPKDPKKISATVQSISSALLSSTNSEMTSEKSIFVENEAALLNSIKDVMNEALSKTQSKQTIPQRRIGNVENFTVLYIDQTEAPDLNLLRSTINFHHVLSDQDTLSAFLSSQNNEQFIVISPAHHAQTVLPELQKHESIHSVYLLSKQMNSPDWINDYDKIIGIYPTIESIRDHLQNTLIIISTRMIPIEITSKNDTTFNHCQLLKETLLHEEHDSDLKKDMLTFCRLHYADNQEVLREIDEFDISSTDLNSIQWYTRPCFVSKILSRAFRTQEIDLLFKMRYFIECLHKQIQSNALNEAATIYTVLNVEDETIRNFQENLNGLVTFGSFLSGTFQRPTLTENRQRLVLFVIRLQPACAANIESFRDTNCKTDVLINFDTVFRIISLDDRHTISLESISRDDAQFQQITQPLREQIATSVMLLQLTRLLLAMNHYAQCDYLTELIYQDKSLENNRTLLASLAAAHHMIGSVDASQRDFATARYQFFKSVRAFQQFLSPTHRMLSATYNNIGSMFNQDNRRDLALHFYEIAVECQLKSSEPDMDSVATYSTNISSVYIEQKRYTEAIKHLQRAAAIREKLPMAENIKPMISLFQKIASCLWNTNKSSEALEYYKKILDLQLRLPNPSPQPTSVTYYNLSTAYERLGDYDQAAVCAEKSIEYLKMISETHPELEENQAQLNSVREKQWLKNVLAVNN
ncbi:unnamed protein product [Adineta ricciae]|uniref:DUF4590 domain-containing protein n=1 Tax=Adineta ricciae TaxID=249248 RepID=A0A816B562_ADIRI|nr:unnamed protein product [Adineta ricciae]CAF1604380.1 unnamed protein product [Adineta ricciae]